MNVLRKSSWSRLTRVTRRFIRVYLINVSVFVDEVTDLILAIDLFSIAYKTLRKRCTYKNIGLQRSMTLLTRVYIGNNTNTTTHL